jgi:hypothetical protein
MAAFHSSTQIAAWYAKITAALAEAGFDAETEAAFHRLINTMLKNGGAIAFDPQALAAAMGVGARAVRRRIAGPMLYGLLYQQDGMIRCTLLDELMANATRLRAKRSAAGRNGAATRWRDKSAVSTASIMANANPEPQTECIAQGPVSVSLPDHPVPAALTDDRADIEVTTDRNQWAPFADDAERRAACSDFLLRRKWKSAWGPKPLERGSYVPRELVEELCIQLGVST